MSKVEIKLGTKIDKAELLGTDISKLGVLTSTRLLQDDVEGQSEYPGMVQCPWCGNIGYVSGLDTDYYVTVVCGACGQPFQA